jgi:hypothetical protein
VQELWALIMDAGTGFTAQTYSLSNQFLPKEWIMVGGHIAVVDMVVAASAHMWLCWALGHIGATFLLCSGTKLHILMGSVSRAGVTVLRAASGACMCSEGPFAVVCDTC